MAMSSTKHRIGGILCVERCKICKDFKAYCSLRTVYGLEVSYELEHPKQRVGNHSVILFLIYWTCCIECLLVISCPPQNGFEKHLRVRT